MEESKKKKVLKMAALLGTLSVPGIIPLVPGALTFYTMQAFLLGAIDNAVHHQVLRPRNSADDDPDAHFKE